MAFCFLEDLEENFNFNLNKKYFEKYFHRDYELRNAGCLFFWLRKKKREVDDLTTKDLYEYMIKHQQ